MVAALAILLQKLQYYHNSRSITTGMEWV